MTPSSSSTVQPIRTLMASDEPVARRKIKQLLQERPDALVLEILHILEGLQTPTKKYLDRIMIKSQDRISFLPATEVHWIEAKGKHSRIHAGKQTCLIREGLQKLETDLDPSIFVRVHKSAIVKIDQIREMHRWFHGSYRIIMDDGTALILSRHYRKNLSQALGRPL